MFEPQSDFFRKYAPKRRPHPLFDSGKYFHLIMIIVGIICKLLVFNHF